MNILYKYLAEKKGRRRELQLLLKIKSRQHMQYLVNAPHLISAKRCLKIEQWSNGEITRKQLRPDWDLVWPELKDD